MVVFVRFYPILQCARQWMCQEVDEHEWKAAALIAVVGIPSDGSHTSAKWCLNAVQITSASASAGCAWALLSLMTQRHTATLGLPHEFFT